MRNLLKLFIGLAIISVFAVSCTKDDVKKNIFKVGNTEYGLNSGHLLNYGVSGNGYNLDLRLYSEGLNLQEEGDGYMAAVGAGKLVYLWLTTSTANSLDAGVYNYSSTPGIVGTFRSGYYNLSYNHVLDADDWNSANTVDIATGSITVSKNSGEYEITIDCTDENGNVITGYYKGAIPIYDDNTIIGNLKK
jgi:hypothetical protein